MEDEDQVMEDEDQVEAEDYVLHRKLIKSIKLLDKKQKGKVKKVVPKLSATDDDGVKVEDLVGSIEGKNQLNDLKKQLVVTDRRNKLLHASAHRQQIERIERSIAYSQVSDEVQKWEDIVQSNRSAEKLAFPLNQIPYKLKTVSEVVAERFQPRTKLEIETAKILGNSKHNLTNEEEYTEAEKELLKAMSLKEAKARTAEIQKARALMSYKAAKFKLQKKIKSKRYHRLLKRQKRKQMLKEFEELRSKDPDAAREKLELLERDRILERAVLKHRGSNIWSKQMRLHARRDPKTKGILQEHMKLGRELREKHNYDSNSDLEEEKTETEDPEKALEQLAEDAEEEELLETKKDNPWLRKNLTHIRKKDDSRMTKEKESVEQQQINNPKENSRIPEQTASLNSKDNKPKKNFKKKKRKQKTINTEENCKDNVDIDTLFDSLDSVIDTSEDKESSAETKKKVRKAPPTTINTVTPAAKSEIRKRNTKKSTSVLKDRKMAELNPKQYLKLNKQSLLEISSQLVQVMDEDETKDKDEQQRLLVAEAFADDDVVEDFQMEKRVLEEAEKPKDIDLTLPGWGNWAGHGLKTENERNRFIIKLPEPPPRKDKLKPGVIISEQQDTTIRKYQVWQPPFPFNSVDEFEASIRQPIGKEWNTESALKALTEPKIITKPGSIIGPMDKKLTFDNSNSDTNEQNESDVE